MYIIYEIVDKRYEDKLFSTSKIFATSDQLGYNKQGRIYPA